MDQAWKWHIISTLNLLDKIACLSVDEKSSDPGPINLLVYLSLWDMG